MRGQHSNSESDKVNKRVQRSRDQAATRMTNKQRQWAVVLMTAMVLTKQLNAQLLLPLPNEFNSSRGDDNATYHNGTNSWSECNAMSQETDAHNRCAPCRSTQHYHHHRTHKHRRRRPPLQLDADAVLSVGSIRRSVACSAVGGLRFGRCTHSQAYATHHLQRVPSRSHTTCLLQFVAPSITEAMAAIFCRLQTHTKAQSSHLQGRHSSSRWSRQRQQHMQHNKHTANAYSADVVATEQPEKEPQSSALSYKMVKGPWQQKKAVVAKEPLQGEQPEDSEYADARLQRQIWSKVRYL